MHNILKFELFSSGQAESDSVTAPPFSRHLLRTLLHPTAIIHIKVFLIGQSQADRRRDFFFCYCCLHWLYCSSCPLCLPMESVFPTAAWVGTYMEGHTGMPELMTYLLSARVTGTSTPFCPIAVKERDMNMVSNAEFLVMLTENLERKQKLF